jgi:hypothetical protein
VKREEKGEMKRGEIYIFFLQEIGKAREKERGQTSKLHSSSSPNPLQILPNPFKILS